MKNQTCLLPWCTVFLMLWLNLKILSVLYCPDYFLQVNLSRVKRVNHSMFAFVPVINSHTFVQVIDAYRLQLHFIVIIPLIKINEFNASYWHFLAGPEFALAGIDRPACHEPTRFLPSAKQIWEDAILAAVPRNRRTIEKRLKRRFGNPEYVWKMMFLKKNLQTCMQCGNFHEPGLLCRKFSVFVCQLVS